MSRLILRRSDGVRIEPADLQRLESWPGCTVLDRSSRMLLVDVSPDCQERIAAEFPDWVITPESSQTPIPDPRPGIRPPD